MISVLRLYIDHNFNGHITRGLSSRGVDCLTARQDGTRCANDPEILRRATQLRRGFVTHDDDFLSIVAHWRARAEEFAGVVYAHPMRVTIGQAIADLELIAAVSEPEDLRNTVIHLPL